MNLNKYILSVNNCTKITALNRKLQIKTFSFCSRDCNENRKLMP